MQPDQLGRYRIVGVLGRGGMGVVYEGHDPQIDRSVAIKTIALDALSDQEKVLFEVRFRSEMRSTGRLQHHNIAALYDTGRDGGTAYIVMERVTGHDLKWHLAAGQRFGTQQAVSITLQLLTALDYAHGRHVIHRDVKPANVMLQSDGVVKLCDFGVARLADADATRTQGLVVGSLRYASPEQILGQTIDARTDVYSAGVMLFELLTGGLPFKGQSDVEILHRIATEDAPSPRSVDPSIPLPIAAAVQRAMAKDPADRFASAAAFAQALAASATPSDIPSAVTWPGLAPAKAAESAEPPSPGPGKRRWPWAVGSATGLATLAALAALAAWGGLALLRPTPASVPAAGPMPAASVVAAATPAQSAGPAAASTLGLPASVAASPATAMAKAGAAAVMPAPPMPPTNPLPLLPKRGAAAATPARPPTQTAAAAADPPLLSLIQGAWRGRLACGAALWPNPSPALAAGYTSELAIEIAGSRISLSRDEASFSEKTVGKLDEQGRFSANGYGAFKNQPGDWVVQAQGAYLAQAKRIEGRLQHLRMGDSSVSRECSLVADRP